VRSSPLHTEIELQRPLLDELREFTSLIVRIRDENDVGINIEFRSTMLYSKSRGSYARDLEPLWASGHWLYDISNSKLLEDFQRRNPHLHPLWDLRHYVIVTDDEIINVIAAEPPIVSPRTDNIRGWIRPGETRLG
jgi:hypothetical protein